MPIHQIEMSPLKEGDRIVVLSQNTSYDAVVLERQDDTVLLCHNNEGLQSFSSHSAANLKYVKTLLNPTAVPLKYKYFNQDSGTLYEITYMPNSTVKVQRFKITATNKSYVTGIKPKSLDPYIGCAAINLTSPRLVSDRPVLSNTPQTQMPPLTLGVAEPLSIYSLQSNLALLAAAASEATFKQPEPKASLATPTVAQSSSSAAPAPYIPYKQAQSAVSSRNNDELPYRKRRHLDSAAAAASDEITKKVPKKVRFSNPESTIIAKPTILTRQSGIVKDSKAYSRLIINIDAHLKFGVPIVYLLHGTVPITADTLFTYACKMFPEKAIEMLDELEHFDSRVTKLEDSCRYAAVMTKDGQNQTPLLISLKNYVRILDKLLELICAILDVLRFYKITVMAKEIAAAEDLEKLAKFYRNSAEIVNVSKRVRSHNQELSTTNSSSGAPSQQQTELARDSNSSRSAEPKTVTPRLL